MNNTNSNPSIFEKSIENNQGELQSLAWEINASKDEFKLFIIRCNYDQWQKILIEKLQSLLTIKMSCLTLNIEDVNLLDRIIKEFGKNQPSSLTVVGLENLENLEQFLAVFNQCRDNFSKKCPFPLLIWVNDEIYQKLVRIAPDFESSGTTRQFSINTDELMKFLEYGVEKFFQNIFARNSRGFYRQLQNTNMVGCLQRQELSFAIAELEKSGQTFSPEIKADLDFIYALESHRQKDGLQDLDKSLDKICQFWQDVSKVGKCLKDCRLKLALAKFYLGGFYLYKDLQLLSAEEQLISWQKSRDLYEECINIFTTENRYDLVAKSITQLERILQKLKLWEQLETVAADALLLHEKYNHKHKFAQDYVFLAEVALEKKSYETSKKLAQKGLDFLLENVPVQDQWDGGLYYLFLALAEKNLGNLETSLAYLEKAKDLGDLGHPEIYLRILAELREIYISQENYLSAFEIKQLQLQTKQQYGLSAFIGAGYLKARKQERNPINTDTSENIALEIHNSGRSLDVKRLLDRLARNDSKLIVIHGFSGVGKSSLIRGGLIPTLEKKYHGFKKNFLVYIRDYENKKWVLELAKSLQKSLIDSGLPNSNLENLEDILRELRLSENRRLRAILIFDQFEEFFFSNAQPLQRQEFFSFLGDCLKLTDVRVVLSLREDYLHYLLECDRLANMEMLNQDILGKNIRYRLGNFSLQDAKTIINNLTSRPQLSFPMDLIEALVQDLGKELGEVRPIELQIVGAQMETENIKTLVAYQEKGPISELVNRYLDAVTKDCGPDNELLAKTLLYFLTDETVPRPRRTREELEQDLVEIQKIEATTDQLDLIFKVFVGSGLVLFLPDSPLNRYQLVHDYLAELIRKDQEPQVTRLKAELEEKNKKLELSESEKQELKTLLDEVKRQKKQIKVLGLGLIFTVALFAMFFVRQQSEQSTIAKVESIKNNSNILIKAGEPLKAVIEAMRAYSILKDKKFFLTKPPNTDILLAESIYNATNNGYALSNILESDSKLKSDSKLSVSFSQDGKTIASGSNDNTVKLWNYQGKLLKTLSDNNDAVRSVSFSPDGNTIASASEDGKIILWNWNYPQKSCKTLPNQIVMRSVSFSRDGKTIASASGDKTVKLWDLQCKLLKTLPMNHDETVTSVSFSRDGKTIASASEDKTIKLWNLQGESLKTLPMNHDGTVTSVSFSRDGKTIASASEDKTIKLWNLQGELLKTLAGHTDTVTSVSFSRDGKTIASSSADNAVKLWDVKSGELRNTLIGHTKVVNSVIFDHQKTGETIASASDDQTIILWKDLDNNLVQNKSKDDGNNTVESIVSPDGKTRAYFFKENNTVKLWNSEGKSLTLIGHQRPVKIVSFSPDGKTIASGSADNTLKLWDVQGGKLLNTLNGHTNTVKSVSFSPNGEIIASGSADNTVKLWNRQGELLSTLIGHTYTVKSVSFSSDGKTLVSVDQDDKMAKWEINSDKLQAKSCQYLHDYLVTHPDTLSELTACQEANIKKEASFFLIEKAEKLAREDQSQEALDNLKLAQKWNPELKKFDPEKKLQLQKNEKLLAEKLNFEGEIVKFKEALRLDPSAPIDNSTVAHDLIIKSQEIAKKGNIQQAIANYQLVENIDKDSKLIMAYDWSKLCLYGSLTDHAQEVLFACEKALALKPDDIYARGNRGIAKAMTGDTKGAIEDFEQAIKDFEHYIQNDDEGKKDEYEKYKLQSQQWIKELNAGKNPLILFNPELKKKLLDESP